MTADSRVDSESVNALMALCQSASQRSRVDTPDSWVHFVGRDQVDDVLRTLETDPRIARHLQERHALYLAGGNGGFGMTPAKHWLGGFVRYAVARPEAEWGYIAERFRSFLAMENGTAPCNVNTTLVGVLLVNTDEIELPDGRLKLGQYDRDRHRNARGGPLPATVFQCETEIPAAIATQRVSFPDPVAEGATREHEEALTRLLLALVFVTSGPVQVDATMYEPVFSGSSVGEQPEDAGPILTGHLTMLDESAAEDLRREYAALADVPVRHVGVAVRRYLIARSERVRPADQVIDYAVAIESMTSEWGGKDQGKELADVVAGNGWEHEQVEGEHKAFRHARERIIHDGEIPADVAQAARLGASLVLRSLRARVRPRNESAL